MSTKIDINRIYREELKRNKQRTKQRTKQFNRATSPLDGLINRCEIVNVEEMLYAGWEIKDIWTLEKTMQDVKRRKITSVDDAMKKTHNKFDRQMFEDMIL